MKAFSIPKLETQAALLATRLKIEIVNALTVMVRIPYVDRYHHRTAVA